MITPLKCVLEIAESIQKRSEPKM